MSSRRGRYNARLYFVDYSFAYKFIRHLRYSTESNIQQRLQLNTVILARAIAPLYKPTIPHMYLITSNKHKRTHYAILTLY
ncbi:hypothetical protein [Calothrix sp. 336/3]|uniref:hypothetical protein n=1 Tax=Calothrix sp. 336/3 TaxID=1337936 RepID=UPI001187689E|nr:hypothetical protein [Calothrix sp. 336/3]